ncbi:hypothetical protein B6N25_08415 [Sphingobacteriales bacterium TSM_CSS]|nr:hypothetical protein B6N25_08415 [Sphingobacteriales bacterium TSM_CSS]
MQKIIPHKGICTFAKLLNNTTPLPMSSLHNLTKTLSSAEKGYINKSIAGTKYADLFNIIAPMQEYDEALVKKKWAAAGNSLKDFAVLKLRLYDKVLEALWQYGKSKGSYREQAMHTVKLANVLYKRNLLSEALDLIADVKPLMTELEHWDILVGILLMEEDCVLAKTDAKNKQEIVRQYHIALCNITEKLALRYRYDSLRKELLILEQENVVARSETAIALAEAIMQNPLMRALPENHDFRTFIIFHTIRRIYYQLTGNFEESFLEQQLIFEAFKKRPIWLKYQDWYFMQITLNYINTCEKTENYVAWEEAISYLTTFEKGIAALPALWLRGQLFSTQIYCCVVQKKWVQFNELIISYNDFYDNNHKKLEQVKIADANCAVSIGLIEQGKGDAALPYIGRVIDLPDTNAVIQYKIIARMLRLTIYSEPAKLKFLEKECDNTVNYLKKFNHRDYSVEFTVIDAIRRLTNKTANPPEIWKKLHADLKKLQNNPLANVGFHYFEYLDWVERKILNN